MIKGIVLYYVKVNLGSILQQGKKEGNCKGYFLHLKMPRTAEQNEKKRIQGLICDGFNT